MSEKKNFEKLEALLAGKDFRHYDNKPYRKLVVERFGGEDEFIALAHYGEQNGTAMRNPEVVFHVEGDRAKPIYYRNDFTGAEHATTAGYCDVTVSLHERLQPELERFVKDWWKSLEGQQFFKLAEARRQAEEETLGKVYFGKPVPEIRYEPAPAIAAEKEPAPLTEAQKNKPEPAKAGKADVYTSVTEHIIQSLEKGTGEFQTPWHGATSLPVNAHSGAEYRGVNVLSLWASAQGKGYDSNEWGTYRQWLELGAQVKNGEKATPVVFWKKLGKNGETQDQELEEGNAKRPLLVAKRYHVFNARQVEGYEPKPHPKLSEAEQIKEANEFFFGLGADIRQDGDHAGYNRKEDKIVMPPFERFRSSAAYYSTLAHELVHWSGHEGRINRDLEGRFGTRKYAAEELVAELGSAFQLARLGISAEPRPDHASYIASWITLLKDDSRALFAAASKAQEATEWLEQQRDVIRGVDENCQTVATKEFVAERVGKAAEALRGYGTDGGQAARVEDLLADVQHWCDAKGVQFEPALAEARTRYAAEVKEFVRDGLSGREAEGVEQGRGR